MAVKRLRKSVKISHRNQSVWLVFLRHCVYTRYKRFALHQQYIIFQPLLIECSTIRHVGLGLRRRWAQISIIRDAVYSNKTHCLKKIAMNRTLELHNMLSFLLFCMFANFAVWLLFGKTVCVIPCKTLVILKLFRG